MRADKVIHAFRDSLPVMTGYAVLGLGFGILMASKGYDVFLVLTEGILIYSGTMQFVLADMLSGSVTLSACALTALMVSARHVFYGVSMVERYRDIHGLQKFYMIFALTDETYSLVCESNDADYCFLVSLFNHSYWITGTIAGSLIGQVLKFDSRGIDFSLTALFVSICVEQWLNADTHIPALTGLTASVLCLLIFGADNFLIPAMFMITCLLFAFRGKIENENV